MKHEVQLSAILSEAQIVDLAKQEFKETRNMRELIEWHIEFLIAKNELYYQDAETIKKCLQNFRK